YLFDHFFSDEMEKAVLLIGDPVLSRALLNDVVPPPRRHRCEVNEAAVVERSHAAERRHQNSSCAVFKQRPDAVARQPLTYAINRCLSVLPSGQTYRRAYPHASVSCREDRGPPAA